MTKTVGFLLVFFSLEMLSAKIVANKKDEINKSYLVAGLGAFDVLRAGSSPQAQVEFLGQTNTSYLRPFFGVLVTDPISAYVYGGIWTDVFLSEQKNIILNLGFSPGLYYQGDGKDLGFPLEFKSTVGLSYQFKESLDRIGVRFYHISNASIGEINPGEESLVFYYGKAI